MTKEQSLADRIRDVIALVRYDIGGLALADLLNIADEVDEMEWRMDSLEK